MRHLSPCLTCTSAGPRHPAGVCGGGPSSPARPGAQTDFLLTADDARDIAEICLRLDGLPLAIELAAARLKLLSPHALLARLSHRLEVLTAGVQDAPARQQTLRNTILWSYDLLTVEEQRLFRRLCVFVAGCTLEAVDALCAALPDSVGQVLEGVTSLLDKSLLQQSEPRQESRASACLRPCGSMGWSACAGAQRS